MGQHRKTKHYRRIFITAVAVGAVGVPSVALACTDWPYGTDPRPRADATSTPVTEGQHLHRHHHRNGVDAAAGQTTAPRTTEPVTTTPSPSAPSSSTPSPSTPDTSTPSPSTPVTSPAKARTAHARPAVRPRTRPVAARPITQWPRPTTAPGTPAATATTPATSTAPTAPTSAAPATPATAAPASGVTAEILRLVNAERNKVGCQPLTLNPELTKAAQDHSADMAAHQNMSHTGSDGSDPGLRITRAGYTWSSYGENVAYGYTTAEQVMAGWMASPGHRANILNCGFQEIGVGLAQPGSYWTQDFGTAR
ncbi:CAP domain-containing protein [Streptomyces sp. DSM 40868]|uniref:CAP domain-containing protein n=1 Tax=Streptomyces eurythermus TaxID=42237 RepID=UPI0004C9D997|nr:MULTISPECIES: CAP domain-containing protein [Streptomyces]QIS69596.1 CAP domain-containing protein [Streptomyces sp. DSM 40868]